MSALTHICNLLNGQYGEKLRRAKLPVIDELVLTILSQNTSASNCNLAFERLKNRFGTWEEVRQADANDIAEAIKPGGLANIKAPRIKRILEQIKQRHRELDLEWLNKLSDAEALDYLLGFEGVGRKTAACVLMFAMGRPVLPVDTHVHRVAERLGLIGRVDADKAHDLLQAMIAPEEVYSFHVNMIAHGREVCRAANPRCGQCILSKECKYFAERSQSK